MGQLAVELKHLFKDQKEEIARLRADVEKVYKELAEIDEETAKLLVKEKIVVNNLETVRLQVHRLANFYYTIEERLDEIRKTVQEEIGSPADMSSSPIGEAEETTTPDLFSVPLDEEEKK